MVSLAFVKSETLTPGAAWKKASDQIRLKMVCDALRESEFAMDGILTVTSTKQDGQVIVSLLSPLSPGIRGTTLLDIEDYLKHKIDPGLVIWLEPLGDRNSLRNLRGIEVKS
jgi:hypothetical protein